MLLQSCAEEEGAGDLKLVVYQLGHTRPNRDENLTARALTAMKKRERWVSNASVARYEKAGRVGQVLSFLSAAVQAKAVRCSNNLGRVLAGTSVS